MAEFKIRLRKLRKDYKMNQGELADVLNYGYTAISNYESGRNEPSIKDLVKIADFFGVSMDYLTGRTEIKECLYIAETNKRNKEVVEKLKGLDFMKKVGELWEELIQQSLL